MSLHSLGEKTMKTAISSTRRYAMFTVTGTSIVKVEEISPTVNGEKYESFGGFYSTKLMYALWKFRD